MARPALLETLPMELKQRILRYLDDIETLHAITHASPEYHTVYLELREELLTKVTLKLLEFRGIDLSEPRDFLQVDLVPAKDKLGVSPRLTALHDAIQALYDQFNNVKNDRRRQKDGYVKIKPEQCQALGSLSRAIGWDVHDLDLEDRHDFVGREQSSWKGFTVGFEKYYILGFGSYHGKEAVMETRIDHRVNIRRQQIFGGTWDAYTVGLTGLENLIRRSGKHGPW
ncbi:MAG: hypothetical protein HETSPECPRED_007209 [Heterodermia speciosa]|uniref:F-box domain-containing protein n=1 Tax=Heterodermia speciosa TaxID=116794 RepID=A0A8H3I7C8_9LECA|nr:MAG: hypothetical protein HETSPECPRED_007209 [Heterodermia speciosa]